MFTKHELKMDSLAEVALFRNCGRRALRRVAKITTRITVSAGRVLCAEGETGRECFIIVDGEATVTIAGDDVASIGAGELFGEIALLDGGRRAATVTAETDMDLLVLSRAEFAELLAEVPMVTLRILEVVAVRLRAADERLYHSRRNTGRAAGQRHCGTFSLIGLDPFEGAVDVADRLLVELGGIPRLEPTVLP